MTTPAQALHAIIDEMAGDDLLPDDLVAGMIINAVSKVAELRPLTTQENRLREAATRVIMEPARPVKGVPVDQQGQQDDAPAILP